MKTTESDILRAGIQTWYNESGLRGGADPAVLKDLGYPEPDQTIAIADEFAARALAQSALDGTVARQKAREEVEALGL